MVVTVGFFGIAIATTILFGFDPCAIKFNVSVMRKYVLHMFENKEIKPFPILYDKNIVYSSLETKRTQRIEAHFNRQFIELKNTLSQERLRTVKGQNEIKKEKINELQLNKKDIDRIGTNRWFNDNLIPYYHTM